MNVTRRRFLRIGGFVLIGLAVRPVFDIFAKFRVAEASGTAGASGEKSWAMVIDMSACLAKDGCRECLDACHRVHNVPDFGNPKDEIKWIWEVPYEGAFPEQGREFIADSFRGRPTIVLCNHCDDPPCVRVCPTKATWKREDGIVMMDYHRCIGCRYCMAACPYGSRSFNWRDPRPFIKELDTAYPTRTKGVVEKCNFCEERLADGLMPACVEACQEKALIFGNLKDPDSDVREILRSRYTIQRQPGLGTRPGVYYLV